MNEPGRRAFLSGLAKACLGVTFLPGLIRGTETTKRGKATRVIYLYMVGGMSHIDTFDPKTKTEIKGEFTPRETGVAGVRVGEPFEEIAKRFKSTALVRSLTSKEGAHERARYQLHTSYPPLSSVAHPSLGSWTVKALGKMNEDLPGYVAVGGTAFASGFFANEYDPFRVGDPANALVNVAPPKAVPGDRVDERIDLRSELGKGFLERFGKWEMVRDYSVFYDKAVRLMRSKDLEAFELSKENEETRDRYGRNAFGQGVLLARRLAEVGVRYTEVAFGNWDTHTDNFEKIRELGGQVDKAVGALIDDLKANGLFDETLIVIASEFGRTPRINEGKGRDHHPGCFSALLAGGGVLGGSVYGATDDEGRAVADKPVTMMDLNATIAYAMGIDPALDTISPVGRPFNISGGGSAIKNLFTG